eukprot:CFRG3988T1
MADELTNMFQNLGTQDHDALVQHFMAVVDSNNPGSCKFFLEANNWNLEAAIASYYDSGNAQTYHQQMNPPEMTMISDTTLDSKEAMGLATPFRQSWKVKNSGKTQWSSSVVLVFIQGFRFSGPHYITVPALMPGQECDLVMPLISPNQAGSFAAAYRLCSREQMELFFGEPMWCVVNVFEEGAVIDEVERVRLQAEQQHQIDVLMQSFTNMNQ